MTVFGKNGLNEICVGPFFSATHFETFKSIQMDSQCILKRLQCPPTEIENIPYHWKIISKHSENVYKRWEASLIMIIFLCVRIHPRNIPTVLSRVVFCRVLLQLTRIRRTLFHKNKSTEKNGSGKDPRNRVVIFLILHGKIRGRIRSELNLRYEVESVTYVTVFCHSEFCVC